MPHFTLVLNSLRTIGDCTDMTLDVFRTRRDVYGFIMSDWQRCFLLFSLCTFGLYKDCLLSRFGCQLLLGLYPALQ